MKKHRDKDSFISKPQYPGGKTALIEFVNKNLKYPKEALENKISGKVFLSFKVDFDGSITDIKIIKGLGFGCDEEATRIVSLLKFTEVKNKGSKVSIQRKLTINFNLPKQKPVSSNSVSYTYVTKKSDEPQKKTYNYTINLE